MATVTLRLHRYNSSAVAPADGTVDADFRGPKFVGDKEGDHHQTVPVIGEIDLDDTHPLTGEIVTEFLAVAPGFNAVVKKAEDVKYAELNVPQDERQYLRLGVWDKIAPGN